MKLAAIRQSLESKEVRKLGWIATSAMEGTADPLTKLKQPYDLLRNMRAGTVDFHGKVNFAEMERKYHEKYAEELGEEWVAAAVQEARKLAAEPDSETKPTTTTAEPEREEKLAMANTCHPRDTRLAWDAAKAEFDA